MQFKGHQPEVANLLRTLKTDINKKTLLQPGKIINDQILLEEVLMKLVFSQASVVDFPQIPNNIRGRCCAIY